MTAVTNIALPILISVVTMAGHSDPTHLQPLVVLLAALTRLVVFNKHVIATLVLLVPPKIQE